MGPFWRNRPGLPARPITACALAVAALGAGAAQPSRPLRSGVDVVTVPVVVTDENGRLVTGLTRDDFTLYEDGIEQPLTLFLGERVPVSLGVVLDVSESMAGERIEDARLALECFVGDLLDARDEAYLMVFNHAPRLVASWTTPPGALRGKLDHLRPTGGTALYDAVAEALDRFEHRRHQRAAIVVVSDGADTASDLGLRQLRMRLRRTDSFVYAIAIDAPTPVRDRSSTRVDARSLRELAGDSGGYAEVIKTSGELAGATARIANELNHQYVLGYVLPPHGADEAFHSIRVRVSVPEYQVRARKGYVAERALRTR